MKATIKIWIENAVRSLETISESPRLDAELLIAHIFSQNRSWILCHLDHTMTLEQLTACDELLLQAISGTPLPYLLGHWEFYGLDFIVTPDVLIPRPETELLVEQAIAWLNLNHHRSLIADIGTGSGCIAIAIARNVSSSMVIASDNSVSALAVARKNVARHGLLDQIALVHTHLMDGLDQTFDLICANLPYVPTSRLDQLAVSKAEPISALDGGEDGFDLIKTLLLQAKSRISRNGCILCEIDMFQSGQAMTLASRLFPEKSIKIIPDLAKNPRLLAID